MRRVSVGPGAVGVCVISWVTEGHPQVEVEGQGGRNGGALHPAPGIWHCCAGGP